jgi:dimethylamine monooxygenase subunit A
MSTFAYPPPSDGKPFRLTMGLRDLKESDWIEIGPDLDYQLPERVSLIKTNRDAVFASVAGYDEQCSAFAHRITANLKMFHSASHLIEQDRITHISTGITVDLNDDHPFVQLAQVIGEDLCLMSLVNGRWTLTAGVVVYPSRWNLREKVGRDIDAIHAPVPGYEQSLINYMTPVFDRLTRQVWRLNWTLHATSELHQIERSAESALPDDYFWRTERQTLTRDGDHVLFTIRNRAEPLRWIQQDPERAAAFAATLESMSSETRDYKGLVDDLPALVSYLTK